MRIRKTLKLLNLSAFPPDAVIQPTPHICKLNQSPWDLLQFSDSSSPPSIFSPNQQIQHEELGGGEINRYVDLSIGGSVEANESDERMKEKTVSKEADIALNSSMDLDIRMNEKNNVSGDDEDGSDGIKMYEISKKDASIQDHCKRKKSEKLPLSVNNVVKRRGRGPGKKASTSNPYEYYYYSGFGPLWGKKRGGDDKNNRENKREKTTIKDNDEVHIADEINDDDEDEGENEDGENNEKKRGRKPMKARSLKSLM